jgi:hypothetical protein
VFTSWLGPAASANQLLDRLLHADLDATLKAIGDIHVKTARRLLNEIRSCDEASRRRRQDAAIMNLETALTAYVQRSSKSDWRTSLWLLKHGRTADQFAVLSINVALALAVLYKAVDDRLGVVWSLDTAERQFRLHEHIAPLPWLTDQAPTGANLHERAGNHVVYRFSQRQRRLDEERRALVQVTATIRNLTEFPA